MGATTEVPDQTEQMDRAPARPDRRQLAIYVLLDCPGCDTARRLAAAAREAAPDLDVRLIDLGAPDVVRPPAVFAVPTYLLDGRVISLGNPEPAWLLARLAAPADAPGAEPVALNGHAPPEVAEHGAPAPAPRTGRRRP